MVFLNLNNNYLIYSKLMIFGLTNYNKWKLKSFLDLFRNKKWKMKVFKLLDPFGCWLQPTIVNFGGITGLHPAVNKIYTLYKFSGLNLSSVLCRIWYCDSRMFSGIMVFWSPASVRGEIHIARNTTNRRWLEKNRSQFFSNFCWN